ncbi:type 1 glutamine amidotransferase domain-containing protein [Aliikangiella coralliicola]|uniref:Type 1 glutamine amidotransferase domain-containing protein n=1 Tax=Aliikangiella coralliicola TaxID=2592383 RepID=A0A545UJX4_9GAMM|nr:type 1 glutamine amidotransferase domain-containing protein [Aliikangiella coralliicola]TQV89767.1 type 1 glutamine amidotransferase domain-containing protein [Aliikangiella coralliicola]
MKTKYSLINRGVTKSVSALFFAIMAFLSMNLYAGGQTSPKVLVVVSGYGVDEGETQPGFEFDEFAKAYLVFKANGIDVDVASPNGGKVVADKYNPEKEYNSRVVVDSVAMKKLSNTLSTQSVKASDYDGVFIVGGKGAMFDLPKDSALQKIIATVYENNGSISAVCHGPAALTDVKLSDGTYLVSGKSVNGFTNVEEKAFGKKWLPKFEFLLEDRLKERGAKFESSAMMLKHVAEDERLITGQNPFSTAATAEALVRSLGVKPVKREMFKDDRTIELVAEILDGKKHAKASFAKQAEKYQPELIAMYGYYRLQFAQNNRELSQAVELMEMSVPYMKNPRLSLAIAQGYKKLGENDKAKSKLVALLKEHPEMDAAQKMLDAM